MQRTKKIRILALIIISVLLVVWVAAIAKCEYLTLRYGEPFQYSYKEHTMLSSPDYMKVLEYSEDRAVIYYAKRGAGGDILILEKQNTQDAWEFVSWTTVWSTSGSADGFIWPYIR